MQKCYKCGTAFKGKTCPECGAKKATHSGALFSFGSFLPRLAPAEVRKKRISALNLFESIAFLVFSVLLFLFFLAPVAVEGKSDAQGLGSVYQLLQDDAAKVLMITMLVLACVAFAASVACYVCRVMTKEKQPALWLNILLGVVPYLFYAAFLILSVVIFILIGSESGTREGLAAGTAPVLILVFSAIAIVLSLASDLAKLFFARVDGYRYGSEKRNKFSEKSDLLNAISAPKLLGLTNLLKLLPSILLALLPVALFLIYLAPVAASNGQSYGNLYQLLQNASELLKQGIGTQPEQIERATATVNSMTAIIVVTAIAAAAAIANLVYRLMRRKYEPNSLLLALPYFIYIIFLITGSALIGQIDAEIEVAVSACPILILSLSILFALLSAAADFLKYYFENTYDFRYACELENLYGDNDKIVGFNLLKGAKKVAEYAFHNCKSLTSIILSDSVMSVGKSAFETCTSLNRVKLGARVSAIGDYAFVDCVALEEIYLPAALKKIGEYAFYNCNRLKDIVYAGTMEEWNALSKGMMWDAKSGEYTIHCTDGDIAKEQ